jgi:integrase/recombinase XerD
MAVGQVLRFPVATAMAGDISAAIESFRRFCLSKNLSRQSVDYYGYRLKAFIRFLTENGLGTALKDVTPQVARAFISWELEHNSASTANHSVVALRVFFAFLADEGVLNGNPAAGLKKVRAPKKLIETFSLEEVERIIETCGKSFTGVRDQAIILLLIDCGLRATELCELTLDDINWHDQTLKVFGKGAKERVVPFGANAHRALSQYVSRRPELGTDKLFVSCYGNPIDRFLLRDIVRSRSRKAGVTGVRASPHTLRHTFAVTYLRAGGDVFSLQKLLGHSDLTMTRRYCELSDSDIVERHRLYSPADRLRAATQPSGGRRRIS